MVPKRSPSCGSGIAGRNFESATQAAVRDLQCTCFRQIQQSEILSNLCQKGTPPKRSCQASQLLPEVTHLEGKKVADTNTFFSTPRRGMTKYTRMPNMAF